MICTSGHANWPLLRINVVLGFVVTLFLIFPVHAQQIIVNTSDKSCELIEKMIQAQANYDLASLVTLERQLDAQLHQNSLAEAPPIDNDADGDASKLWQEIYLSIDRVRKTIKPENLQKLKYFRVAARKSYNPSRFSSINEADLILGDIDAIKRDCCIGFANRLRWNQFLVPQCEIFYWLGLAYAAERDDKKSVACFIIGLRDQKRSHSACSSGLIPTFIGKCSESGCGSAYPLAAANFQKAEREFQSEEKDFENLKLRAKYGEQ